jgi:hypothetical protein
MRNYFTRACAHVNANVYCDYSASSILIPHTDISILQINRFGCVGNNLICTIQCDGTYVVFGMATAVLSMNQ